MGKWLLFGQFVKFVGSHFVLEINVLLDLLERLLQLVDSTQSLHVVILQYRLHVFLYLILD